MVEGFSCQSVEKFIKTCYNEFNKLEFVEVCEYEKDISDYIVLYDCVFACRMWQ